MTQKDHFLTLGPNSCMVRLRAAIAIIGQWVIVFQFLYGAIKGVTKKLLSGEYVSFQFLYGAIKG